MKRQDGGAAAGRRREREFGSGGVPTTDDGSSTEGGEKSNMAWRWGWSQRAARGGDGMAAGAAGRKGREQKVICRCVGGPT